MKLRVPNWVRWALSVACVLATCVAAVVAYVDGGLFGLGLLFLALIALLSVLSAVFPRQGGGGP